MSSFFGKVAERVRRSQPYLIAALECVGRDAYAVTAGGGSVFLPL